MELFGDDNPYSEKDVQNMHLAYLQRASGHTRAKFSEDTPDNIEFIA